MAGKGRGLRFLAVAAGIGLTAALIDPADATQNAISGQATVVDGDHLILQGYRVLLYGIDAPELAQHCLADGVPWPCGQEAAAALTEIIVGQTLTCTDKGDAPYAKISGVCRVGEIDLNAWLVSEGWALAVRHITRAYSKQEKAAKKANLGVWRGEFVKPWNWREGERLD